MAKKPIKPRDRIKKVLEITLGEQAQERKLHNNRPMPGDIRSATSLPDEDRLSRALAKSEAADVALRRKAKEGKPGEGEIFEAKSGTTDEEQERIRVEKFLHLAKERFKLAAEAENKTRAEALDDLEFRIGQQWPKELSGARTLDGRPCLTMNRLPATIRQVTNNQRQQRPAIQVNPVGDGASQDTAEILEGMVRHIEVASEAEIAYDSAFEQMVISGFGFFRITTEVLDSATNQQELRIKRIKDPFSVYFDPAAVEPDYSDARYCFVIEDVPKSEYEARYGDTEAATLADFSSIGDNAADWATKDTIRVAEYFHIEPETKDTEDEETGEVIPGEPRKVVWSKINAVEVIDERDLPGKYITVIPVLGDDLVVNGERHLAGLVRHAKDAQRMYNYWVSAATEMIALAPRAPFVGAEGQFENHEQQWNQANVRNYGYLEYKAVSVSGNLAPPPARQVFEPPVQSINLMTMQADHDLKAITGLFDPSLGENKKDQSGKAIQSLQKQGDVATLNFSDNLSRAMRHAGRILLDQIPKIYDVAAVQRIINPDQSVDHVITHTGQPNEAQALATNKIKRIYDIGTGTYDVTVAVGPSYQTKRQEAVAAQVALVQAYPEVFNVIGDLLVGNMDWPQSKEMSQRLKKTLPPQLLDDKSDDPEQQVLMLQAQMKQMGEQHGQLVQALNNANQVIQTKSVENQAKAGIEQMKIQAQMTMSKMANDLKIALAEIQTNAQSASERQAFVGEFESQMHSQAHDIAMQKDQQSHEARLTDQQADHDKALAKMKPKPKPNGSAN